jgi:hypothetical protein
MASREAAASTWQTAQPFVLALVLGLIAPGPYIANALGWQVTSCAASARARADVERLSSVCAAQARMEIPNPSELDPTARASLAEKWAVMPGETSAVFDVTTTCAGKLGRADY